MKYAVNNSQEKKRSIDAPRGFEGAVSERHRIKCAPERPYIDPLVDHRSDLNARQLGGAIRSAAHDGGFVFEQQRVSSCSDLFE